MNDWINIQEQEPPEDTPVLFREMFSDEYHVGYWDKEENCMKQFKGTCEGYKWLVAKWAYID